jgi:hypothetical protein
MYITKTTIWVQSDDDDDDDDDEADNNILEGSNILELHWSLSQSAKSNRGNYMIHVNFELVYLDPLKGYGD